MTVAGATSVVRGIPNRSRARMAAMKPARATTTHSTASLTARERLRPSDATRPDSIWARICPSIQLRRRAPIQWANRMRRPVPSRSTTAGSRWFWNQD